VLLSRGGDLILSFLEGIGKEIEYAVTYGQAILGK